MESVKYLIIAPIMSPTAVQVVRHLQAEALRQGGEQVKIPEFSYRPNDWDEEKMEHVTIGPPLWTNYQHASRLNLGLDTLLLRAQQGEELTLCRLAVKKLGWFRNEHEDVLKLDVSSPLLEQIARKLREVVQNEEGYEWCYPLAEEEVHLHLTICSGQGMYHLLNPWVESVNLGFKRFHVRVPCLLPLARYKKGWRMLSYDPALDT